MSGIEFDVTIAEIAEADLEALYDYVCKTRSVDIADSMLDKLQQIIGTLKTSPERGTRPDEFIDGGGDKIRQLILWPYRVIYEISGAVVEVFAVLDGRLDARTLLKSRLYSR
jgi:toxin ParE1/3/4